MTPWLPDRYSLMGVHMDTIMRCRDMGLNSKLGEYCGLIHGAMSAALADAVERLDLDDWTSATGSYIPWRPEADERAKARQIGVCVRDKSPANYVFPEGRSETGHVLKRAPRPADSVFITFVSFARTDVDEVCRLLPNDGQRKPDGAILHWEWTKWSPATPSLPADYRNRYRERIWP